MTEKSGIFSVSEGPFKVYESHDLNVETPKSSHSSTRLIRKSFMLNRGVFNRPRNKVSSLTQLFINNNPLKICEEPLNTPPTIKSPEIEPFAPIKPRRLISKTELKPKKLVFQDQDDHESEIVDLITPLRLRSEVKVQPMNDDDGTNEASKNNDIIMKEKLRGAEENVRLRRRKQRPSDDKENRIEFYYWKNNTNLIGSQIFPTQAGLNVKSLNQEKKSIARGGLKHLRI